MLSASTSTPWASMAAMRVLVSSIRRAGASSGCLIRAIALGTQQWACTSMVLTRLPATTTSRRRAWACACACPACAAGAIAIIVQLGKAMGGAPDVAPRLPAKDMSFPPVCCCGPEPTGKNGRRLGLPVGSMARVHRDLDHHVVVVEIAAPGAQGVLEAEGGPAERPDVLASVDIGHADHEEVAGLRAEHRRIEAVLAADRPVAVVVERAVAVLQRQPGVPVGLDGAAEGVGVAVGHAADAPGAGAGIDVDAHEMQAVDEVGAAGGLDIDRGTVREVDPWLVGHALAGGERIVGREIVVHRG